MNLRLFALTVGAYLALLPLSLGQSQNELYNPHLKLEVWVDSFSQLSAFEQVNQQVFHQQSDFKFGNTEHAYWFRYRLRNTHQEPQEWWLKVGVFDSLSLFQISENAVKRTDRGLLHAYTPEEKQAFQSLQADKYGFKVTLAAGSSSEFYLRVKNIVRFENSAAQISWQPLERHQQQLAKAAIGFTAFHAAFFGIFIFFIFFSLIQYFQNKDKAYFFYAIYVGLSAYYFWWKFEKSNAFLNFIFTEFPAYYYYFESPLATLIYISYFLFVIHFLNAKKELPRFYNILKIATPLLLLSLLVNLLFAKYYGLSASWEVSYWMRYLLIPLSFYTIYQVFKKRHQLGFYILSGTSFMLVGGIITSLLSKLTADHYLNNWDIPLLPIQLGMLAELFFFTTGLAYKSRLAVAEHTAMRLDLQQQEQETRQLRKHKQELTQLYSNLSHEFRTPLTVIIGALTQIKGHRQERELIGRNGERLLQMVNQVLDLNKVEANKMEVKWQQGDVMLFTAYVAEAFEMLARQKQIQLNISCSPQRLIMDFDLEKLQAILSNLLSNSIKYTPNGGWVSLAIHKKEDQLHITISDSGCGIPSAYQSSIFDHYTQLPHTKGGTGLGLAIVKEFTILLGGDIQLRSQVDEGSMFTLSLPIHRQAPLALKWIQVELEASLPECKNTYQAPVKCQSGRPSLLLVEDNEDVLQVLKLQLQEDYNIFTSPNGKEGLITAKKQCPDLIISDVMMPFMDGYEMCRQLKRHATTCRIPVLLLTAKAQLEDKLTSLRAEADAYLCKPPAPEELRLTIKQLLNKQKIQGQAAAGFLKKTSLGSEEKQAAIVFMDKLHGILNDQLQKESFKVADICLLLGTNHVSLNKKVKAYTGQPTATYIRNYRLQIAKELLQQTDLTVAEVAYSVGITEASNFSNMFKKAFGISPCEWKMEGLVAEV